MPQGISKLMRRCLSLLPLLQYKFDTSASWEIDRVVSRVCFSIEHGLKLDRTDTVSDDHRYNQSSIIVNHELAR